MEHQIINIDTKKYVYMCDIYDTKLLFALSRDEYQKYKKMYGEYLYYVEVFKMPESYTVQVLKMTEIAEEIYELQDLTTIPYQVKRIYFTFPSSASIQN